MNLFQTYCNLINISKLSKFETSIHFIYFNYKKNGKNEIDIKELNKYFSEAHLPLFNVTRVKEKLKKSRKIIKSVTNTNKYSLKRSTINEFDEKFSYLFNSENINLQELKANLRGTPFLNEIDINNAKQMAELYIIIHCYENSVRKVIENILLENLGENWWDTAANSGMKNKYTTRKNKETSNRWISPRGNVSPLFYLDWGDLLRLIRRYESEFSSKIPDLKFIELRFEELERIRNIVAHNGVLPSEDDFQRIILSFKDWCKQLSPT